ncbi:hypothetical protein RhiirA4_478936 [Rhizophagus irregularis]|uniref:Uncharacterized protein n=1 Tax=Rhizophagus irregularis TaxID=588596 RepID=A0A2I1HFP4_9GLOM|nr:hypothetical protein RhiirA4_478936 [Rhizophagus irregularis]
MSGNRKSKWTNQNEKPVLGCMNKSRMKIRKRNFKEILKSSKSTTEGIVQVAKQTAESVSQIHNIQPDTVSSTLINLKSKTSPNV